MGLSCAAYSLVSPRACRSLSGWQPVRSTACPWLKCHGTDMACLINETIRSLTLNHSWSLRFQHDPKDILRNEYRAICQCFPWIWRYFAFNMTLLNNYPNISDQNKLINRIINRSHLRSVIDVGKIVWCYSAISWRNVAIGIGDIIKNRGPWVDFNDESLMLRLRELPLPTWPNHFRFVINLNYL